MAKPHRPSRALTSVGRALADAMTGTVTERAADLRVAAHDASHVTIVPRVLATPADAHDVAAAFAIAREHSIPITFRSGGTSLSGQAGGNGILLDVRKGFRQLAILDGGAGVRVGPGMTLRAVNTRLAPRGRMLGPDPASDIACTIGGVLANNSSGMTCGTHANAYSTISSCTVVLASGTIVRTGDPDADDRLAREEPALHAGLLALRDEVRAHPVAVRDIRRLFSIKNTMGYAIVALLDHDTPVRILEHLLIGSEGTLGFIAEAELHTVPAHAHAATALLIAPHLSAAAELIPVLAAGGADTVELLDAASIRIAAALEGAPAALTEVADGTSVALLVEVRGSDPAELQQRADRLRDALARARGPAFEPTSDPAERATLWRARKGLYAAVAGVRPPGTTALLEDIAVPVAVLGTTCERLTTLLNAHGYRDAVIFGHAKDGNLHFLIVEDFTSSSGRERFAAFTNELVELVLDAGGTLKAEHGTGRVMAPFVERQYGAYLTGVMRRIKDLCDPHGILNPGVVLTDDPHGHLSDIVPAPQIEAEVDRCVECGYCEPVCPSRDLTLTPRGRIVLRREIARADEAGDAALAAELREAERYDSEQTCAVDGMCATACPVGINTGDLVRRLRAERAPALAQALGDAAARSFRASSAGVSLALSTAQALPPGIPTTMTRTARRLLPHELVPSWTSDLPPGGRARRPRAVDNPDGVLFPACVGRMFGDVDDAVLSSANAVERLAAIADRTLRIPDGIADLCCGTPWSSKGLRRGRERMRARTRSALLAATDNGRLPVVTDASSCAEGLRATLSGSAVTVIDSPEFVATHLLPLLPPVPDDHRLDRLVLHPTCSSVSGGTTDSLTALAHHIAHEVIVPDAWGCCGFAGDRGLLHPELTASATAAEAAEVRALDATAYASTNRTCEIAMTRATGQNYVPLVSVLCRVIEGVAQ